MTPLKSNTPLLYAPTGPCSFPIMPDLKYLCNSWTILVTPGWSVEWVQSTARNTSYSQGFMYTCRVKEIQQKI